MKKFDRSDIKLSFIKSETKFYVDEKKGVVACVLTSELKTPFGFASPVYLPSRIFTCKGVAKCHEVDVFDEERGKRVALAKAENKCYFEAMKWTHEQLEYIDFISDCIYDFHDRGIIQCEHNLEYIKRISDENHPDYKKKLTKIKHGTTNGKLNY
jgi:hypothetical protein